MPFSLHVAVFIIAGVFFTTELFGSLDFLCSLLVLLALLPLGTFP